MITSLGEDFVFAELLLTMVFLAAAIDFVARMPGWSTAGLDLQYTNTKNKFPKKSEGLRQIRDHCWKALGKDNLNMLCLFLCDPFWHIFNITFQITSKQKQTSQIQIRLVEYSSFEVSDPSEVPRFLTKLIFQLVKEVKLICVRSIKSCSRVSVIGQYETSILRFFSKVVSNKLELRSQYTSDSLLKHRFELQGPVLSLKDPWKTPFLEHQRNQPVLRSYKKSNTLPRVVWAEQSKTGLNFKIRPLQKKL